MTIGHLVFIENYDIEIGRMLVGGDVWLNNRRPWKQAGLAVWKLPTRSLVRYMDGWWREVFDGDNGFSIGDDSHLMI